MMPTSVSIICPTNWNLQKIRGWLYATRIKLSNPLFLMLIPFLTQPPHERTLTGRGSRVYPKGRGSWVYPNGRGSIQIVHLNPISNPTPPRTQGSRVYPKGRGSRVRPGRGRRCARVSPSRLALAARCMNSYYTIRIKNVWIGTKTTLCTNSYYTICITIVWIRFYEFVQKLVKKKPVSAIHHPTTSISGHFISYNKNTIRKLRLYKFIREAYCRTRGARPANVQKTGKILP
jgi:hypothetical protein